MVKPDRLKIADLSAWAVEALLADRGTEGTSDQVMNENLESKTANFCVA